jgi:hypothetical protein
VAALDPPEIAGRLDALDAEREHEGEARSEDG